MSNALRAKTKVGFVDGSSSKPSPTSPDAAAWEKCGSMVISWIFISLSKEFHESVVYAETAYDMWNDLRDKFLQDNAPRVHQIRRALSLLQQVGLSIAAYCTKFKSLCDELGTYSSVPICTCGAPQEFIPELEKERVHHLQILEL